MERKPTQSVERLGKISPVLPIRFFKPLPDQSDLRKKKRPQSQQPANDEEQRVKHSDNSIDLKA